MKETSSFSKFGHLSTKAMYPSWDNFLQCVRFIPLNSTQFCKTICKKDIISFATMEMPYGFISIAIQSYSILNLQILAKLICCIWFLNTLIRLNYDCVCFAEKIQFHDKNGVWTHIIFFIQLCNLVKLFFFFKLWNVFKKTDLCSLFLNSLAH